MRRRVMTAFMCAIMTMSVIPVNADDTTGNGIYSEDRNNNRNVNTIHNENRKKEDI